MNRGTKLTYEFVQLKGLFPEVEYPIREEQVLVSTFRESHRLRIGSSVIDLLLQVCT